MKPERVWSIYNDCKKAKTPFFFKQWGAYKLTDNFIFEKVQEFPK